MVLLVRPQFALAAKPPPLRLMDRAWDPSRRNDGDRTSMVRTSAPSSAYTPSEVAVACATIHGSDAPSTRAIVTLRQFSGNPMQEDSIGLENKGAAAPSAKDKAKPNCIPASTSSCGRLVKPCHRSLDAAHNPPANRRAPSGDRNIGVPTDNPKVGGGEYFRTYSPSGRR